MMKTVSSKQGIETGLEELIALQGRIKSGHLAKTAGLKTRSGNHLSRRRGRGMDFAETRHYQAGDEIRHMEWKVTARTGRPHIKTFLEEKERPVILLMDFNPSMYFGTRIAFKSVVAAELASLIGWSAIKQGDRLGGLLFSGEQQDIFLPKSRKGSLLPLLKKLSEYTRAHAENTSVKPGTLSAALEKTRQMIRSGAMLVIISDFYQMDKTLEKNLLAIGKNNDILAYQICDPLELSPPKPGIYPLTNHKTFLLLDTAASSVADAWRHWCKQRQASLGQMFKKTNVSWQLVTAQDDLAMLVQKTFPERSIG